MLSKLVFGTQNKIVDPISDLKLYTTIKYAVLSGGINQIDTGHSFRDHRSEYIAGLAIRTLVNKFNVGRNEIFVCSK